MVNVSDFVARCDAFAARRGIKRATASTIILSDGKRLDALANGGGITVARLERAMERLSQIENGRIEAKRPRGKQIADT